MDTIPKLSYPDSMKLIREAVKKDQAIDELVYKMGFDSRDLAVKAVNQCLIENAERSNTSLYTLCFNTVPDIKYDWDMENNKTTATITLKPIQFDFEHDVGYWKNKYYELKKQIQELINEPIHTQQ